MSISPLTSSETINSALLARLISSVSNLNIISDSHSDKPFLKAIPRPTLFFRGILFGQIYRFTNIGFILSIVFGALVFALGHLYQSQDFTTLVGIFLTTFLGAILFAWVYVEWNYNLWVSIFLHLFMNLFWMMFSVSDNAFGGTYANIFRIITVVFIIGLTVLYKLKKGIKFEINKNTLLMKRNWLQHFV